MNALEAYTFGIIYGTMHRLEMGDISQEECVRIVKEAVKRAMDAANEEIDEGRK